MFSSSPQSCQYYSSNNTNSPNNNDNGYKTESSTLPTQGRYNHETKTNHISGNYMTSDSSWHHLDHDYALGSPTPTTSPSFPLQQYSSMLTPPTSTPYVLSHSAATAAVTSNNLGHHSDMTPSHSSGPGTPTSLPSYGYGLSHRGFFPRPKLTTTLWEDERTICFQVDANGICVARREDNDMINGTKLLNVAGMSRGKRDGILKNEKGRVVVKVGAMHLKGVWITFDRAKTLSAQFKIQDILYPLFVDNPQTFLYSHPITSPISRLGSFRPFYPSSWDRTLPSSSSSSLSSSTTSPVHHHHHHYQQQHGLDLSSPPDTHHVASIPAPFAYRPGLPPGGSPLTPQSSTSYGGRGNSELLSMDYRSGDTTSDSLTEQGNPSSPSASHGTPYYSDLLNPNHRSNNDVTFYDPPTNSNRVAPPSSGSNNGNNTILGNHDSSPLLDATKRPADSLPPASAFQSLDAATFHHSQSLYMDSSTSSTSSNSKDPYHSSTSSLNHHQQQQIYLPNPAPNSIINSNNNSNNNNNNNSSSSSSSSKNNNNNNSTLSSNTTSYFSSSSSDNATGNSNSRSPNHVGSTVNGISNSGSTGNMDPPTRKDSLIMNHYNKNSTHRHHPYANNAVSPPKLSSLQDQLSLPHLYSPLGHTSSGQHKKPSTPRHCQYPPSRPLAKEIDDLSIKPESDHSSRPW